MVNSLLSRCRDGKDILLQGREAGDPKLDFAQAVSEGLSGESKSLPCQYLYDARGSALFEQICQQPEYYLTRTETEILRRHADEISNITGPIRLVELGSGTSIKTRHILKAYADIEDSPHYVPVDVSAAAMKEARSAIKQELPEVRVTGIIGPFEEALGVLHELSPLMMLFLGSTIGNFPEKETQSFMTMLADQLDHDDYFLLGVDLVKDEAVLEAAYNDAAGVSDRFTLNLFARMNRELDAGIDLDVLAHEAIYNAEKRRIEIYARFHDDQEIYLEPLDESISIEAGERVRTEISRKFRLADIGNLLKSCGFKTLRIFTDDREWFALLLLGRSESHA